METSTLNKIPISFTEQAIEEIKRLSLEQESNKYLRVGVKGGGCSGMTYVLDFDTKSDDDVLYQVDSFEFIMKPAHEMYLYGLTIAFDSGLNARGFTFINPNASSTCGCGTSFAV